jgi:hypothetical protein
MYKKGARIARWSYGYAVMASSSAVVAPDHSCDTAVNDAVEEPGEELHDGLRDNSDEESSAEGARFMNLARLEAAWRTWVRQHRGKVPRSVPESVEDLSGLPIDESILEEVTLELG